jgi:hypothetical protein
MLHVIEEAWKGLAWLMSEFESILTRLQYFSTSVRLLSARVR